MLKTCSKCRHEKPLEDFHRMASSADGRHHYCKLCKRASDKASRERRPGSNAARCQAYHEENREVRLEKMSVYGSQRREDLGDIERQRVNAAHRANPDARRNREGRRRAKIQEAYVEDVLPLVILELDDGICQICFDDVDPFYFHVDHIIPLALGGEHSYINCQLAHPSCNLRKGAKI